MLKEDSSFYRTSVKLFSFFQKYFPDHLRSSQAASQKMGTLERTEKARKILLQEYFSSTSRVPELEGFLHLKDGYKKSWKKVYCILRASGLYYSTKGKQKVRNKCLVWELTLIVKEQQTLHAHLTWILLIILFCIDCKTFDTTGAV